MRFANQFIPRTESVSLITVILMVKITVTDSQPLPKKENVNINLEGEPIEAGFVSAINPTVYWINSDTL